MKYIFPLLLSFAFAASVYGQGTDLLYKKLNSQSNKVEIASKLREIYQDESIDSLFGIGKFMLKEGINQDNQSWIIYGKLLMGNYYTHKIKPKLGLDYLQQCEKYYSKRQDYLVLADVQNLIGLNYLYLTEYDQAANYFVKSLNTAEELGPDHELYMGQLNLAEVYIRRGKYDMAESEGLSYLDKSKQKGLLQGQRKAYDVLTKIAIQQGDFEKAKTYAQQSFELSSKQHSKAGRANSYTNLAITYFESGEDQLALENFQKALTLRLETKEPRLISEGYFNLGEWHFYLERYKDAIPFYEKSLQVALENDLLVEISDAHNQLAACYKALGDHKKALQSMEEYVAKIKLIQRNNQNKDADFQRIAYELDVEERMLEQKKREDKINERVLEEQDRARFIVIGFSIIGIAFLVYFIFQRLNTSLFSKNTVVKKDSEVADLRLVRASLNRVEHYVDQLGIQHSVFEGLTGIGKAVVYELNPDVKIWLPLKFGSIENFLIHDYFQKSKGVFTSVELFLEGLKRLNFVHFSEFECVKVEKRNGQLDVQVVQESTHVFPQEKRMEINDRIHLEKYLLMLSHVGYQNLSQDHKKEDFKKQSDLLISMNPKLAKTLLEETWLEELNKGSLHILYYKSER